MFSTGIRHNVGFLSGRGYFGGSEVVLKMFSIVGVQNKWFACVGVHDLDPRAAHAQIAFSSWNG